MEFHYHTIDTFPVIEQERKMISPHKLKGRKNESYSLIQDLGGSQLMKKLMIFGVIETGLSILICFRSGCCEKKRKCSRSIG